MKMKLELLPALLLLAVLIFACKGSKKTTEDKKDDLEAKTDSTANTPEEVAFVGVQVLEMKKAACFGTCPVYTLKVFDNGKVEYHGTNHTEKLGVYSRRLSREVYQGLMEYVQSVNLGQYEDYYHSGATDLPMTTITHYGYDSSKTVRGDFSRPEPVKELEKKLVVIADGGDWLQEEVQVPHNVTANELIVELKEGVDGEEWVNNFARYELKIIRKIAPNLNLWLLGFNEEKIRPGRLVVLLRNEEEVKEVEFNKELKERN